MAPKKKKWPRGSLPFRLHKLQEAFGLSNPEMADKIGITYRTYCAWKWGESTPTSLGWRRVAELEAEAKRL